MFYKGLFGQLDSQLATISKHTTPAKKAFFLQYVLSFWPDMVYVVNKKALQFARLFELLYICYFKVIS